MRVGVGGVRYDEDGKEAGSDSTGPEIWHQRVFDLSSQAGTTLMQMYVGAPQQTGPGAWSIDFTDMMLYSAAGATWIPIQTEGHAVSLAYWGGSFSGGYTANATWAVGPVAATTGKSEHYYFGDHLGTAQMEFNSGGWPVWQGQFAPFGDEIKNGAPLQANMPDGSANHYKFTGKERDTESGLDYFGARYYSSNMGRFMSPDPMLIMKQKMTDPQQWNMYSYVRNNPLKMVDTNGKWPTDIHNQIIDRAFPGLSSHQRDVLKSASAGMDHCIMCQTEKNSYQHSMRAPDQNPAEAKQESQNYIKSEEGKAQADQKGTVTNTSQINDKSLGDFGDAAHTVADGTSPAHVDGSGNPLPWDPYSYSGVQAHEAADPRSHQTK